ncbi:Rap1a/Tai family immunity protein [Gulbenkiania mobilis]|uniref:Rap1a/Tai family immunity protein n=1 Tax=Gulbenkiania mobilis TaxID=397457 RepID=UPI0006BBCCA3|nr:Rap1a/Tai family immunity protein [Gulbenkiania mobilis]
MTKWASDRILTIAVVTGLLAGPTIAAGDQTKPPVVGLGFWKASQLYELCTSQYQTDRAHCEGFITGVASTLQDEQISRVRVCIPKGTSSNDVVHKVVWYLREKADADDMKIEAVSLIGPLLSVLYNCTPGQRPQLAQ